MPFYPRVSGFRASTERQVTLAMAAACSVCFLAGLPTALAEWRGETIVAAMGSGDSSAQGEIMERFADMDPVDLPDRAQAALAQIALTTAAQAKDPGLRELGRIRASEIIGHLRGTRPLWAPTLILSAQWAIISTAPDTPLPAQALSDYAASYRAAPFLRHEARWRIALGALAWERLDRTTHRHMIDEAVWLTHYDSRQRDGIEADMGNTAAGAAFQLALEPADEPAPQI